MIDQGKVKLIAVSKIAKKAGRIIIPIKKGNTYLTGQHIDPDDEKTFGNLTLNQMTGKEPLTDEQKKKFPFVIAPIDENGEDLQIRLNGNYEYDRQNPEDAAYLNWIENFIPEVAKTKDSVVRGKHHFYLENKEEEAKKIIEKDELWFKSMEFVQKATTDRLVDISLMLNYTLKNFLLNPRVLSHTQLKARLHEACKDSPAKVLEAFAPTSMTDIFILKLVHYGILIKKGEDFYDGVVFIGNTINSVKTYMSKQENSPLKDKWGKLLLEKSGKLPPSSFISTEERAIETIKEIKVALVDKDIERGYILVNKLSTYRGYEQQAEDYRKRFEPFLNMAGNESQQKEVDKNTQPEDKEAIGIYIESNKDKTVGQLRNTARLRKLDVDYNNMEKDELLVLLANNSVKKVTA